MSTTILHKRNAIAGTTPAPANLLVGELAINTADGRLYLKKQDGTVVLVNPPAAVMQSVTIDFGTIPVCAEIFVANVSGAVLGQKVVCSISADVPGSDVDELELDPLFVSAKVTALGQITFVAGTTNATSYVVGQRTINFYVG